MTSPMRLPPGFQASYQARDTYPCNYTHRSVSTYPSALAEYQRKLNLVADNLCHKDLDRVEVGIRDLKPDNGSVQCIEKKNIHTPEKLTDWFGIRELQQGTEKAAPGQLTVSRKDPKCRFIYIFGDHSRACLNITRSMLNEILTFHQVFPEFLDFLFVFGLQSEPQDLRFSSFRAQRSLRETCRSLGIESLARSGRQYQLCYNLKGVTEKSRDEKNLSNNEYSIRPAAFYHRFDVENGNSLWIVTKGGTDIQKRFKELTGEKARPEDKSFGNLEECFRSSLSAHLSFCHWSAEGWREYIKWLEQIVEQETRTAVIGPSRHHLYTTSDIQNLLTLGERINEAIGILEANVEVINTLKLFYERLGDDKDFRLAQCDHDIEDFTSQLDYIVYDIKLQIGRSKALRSKMNDRTELVKQHRMERLNRNLEKEAIIMRIVTIVTLIYLPATFVSTVFSTDIIKYQDSNSPNGSYSPVAMKRWIQVTVPLTVLTLALAYSTKRWAEHRSVSRQELIKLTDRLGPEAQRTGPDGATPWTEGNSGEQARGWLTPSPTPPLWRRSPWKPWGEKANRALKWCRPRAMIASSPGLPLHNRHGQQNPHSTM